MKDEIHAFGNDFSVVQYIKKYLANSAWSLYAEFKFYIPFRTY